MENEKDMLLRNILVVIHIMGNLLMMRGLDKVNMSMFLIVKFMKENGKVIKSMGSVNLLGEMVIAISESG